MDKIIRSDLGDAAMLWTWPGGISRDLSRRVLRAYRQCHSDPELRRAGVVDVVPAYCSIAVHFDVTAADVPTICSRVEELMNSNTMGDDDILVDTGVGTGSDEEATVVLPVKYDGEDLPRVAELTGLDIPRIIALHQERPCTVAMIGFRPHFPYLIGMAEELATPRLSSPRKRVPAGSVGIAGPQTGVYPLESPGGWNIIGTTDPALLVSLRPGDTVRFTEVTDAAHQL